MTATGVLLARARDATRTMRRLSGAERDTALEAIRDAIRAEETEIREANQKDLASAAGIPPALRDRLLLSRDRIAQMVRAVDEVRSLPDPLAERRALGSGRSGIRVLRQRIPLGVIAIVYEARPNVTAECAALSIKSGNVVLLRGGKEAIETNRAICRAVSAGLSRSRVPKDGVLLLEDTSHEAVVELLGATGKVDLVIPRGGSGLMAVVDAHARVPVIRHGQGICHVYVDRDADDDMAVEIAHNAKVQRPGVCNAMETLLVHEAKLSSVLERLGPKLARSGVEIRADRASKAVLERAGIPAKDAATSDWDTEFLDLILAIRSVHDLEEALDHIADHGTNHTASIVTRDRETAERFLGEVDASCVLWNASTRMNDGGELGLGAEMGISTSKMHAYGPMSIHELTAEKLVVYGDGQVRA